MLRYFFNCINTIIKKICTKMSKCTMCVDRLADGLAPVCTLSRPLRAMDFAKKSGAKVIGITDGSTSPFVGVADTLIYAKSDMVSFLDSLVAPLSLINALIVSVGVKSKENTAETFKRLETIWADYDVYENS